MIRKEELLGLIDPIDLQRMAAFDAAETLAQNWEDAQACGESLESLVNDVDEVISHLLAWKRDVGGFCGFESPPQPIIQ